MTLHNLIQNNTVDAMPTDETYLKYILEQLSGTDDISYRKMMGEYIIYYRGKIAAELCDNRFLVKPVPAAEKLLPDAPREPPYEGAKPMLLVEDTDDAEFLCRLLSEIYDELPARKVRTKKMQ